MFRLTRTTIAAILLTTAVAHADPIEGNWKTQSGDTAAISGCGGAFCIKLTTGQFSGKSIGRMKAGGGGKYTGSITKPSTGKTYSGTGKLSGTSLKMTGCVMAVLCESQTWSKLYGVGSRE
jgi:uncharacterized protein (DUF2147 family)